MMPLFILQCIKVLPFYHVQYIHPSPFSEVPLHFLIAGQLSGKRNSGLLYSKPTELYVLWFVTSINETRYKRSEPTKKFFAIKKILQGGKLCSLLYLKRVRRYPC
jgi:hypothetical protein